MEKKEIKKEKKAQATLKYLKVAPRKTRQMADLIRGMSVNQAEAELLYRPQRASGPMLKLLRSALSNARNKQMEKDTLFVQEVCVDQGPMLKRFMPRAKGRATMIQKKMSHIKITLASGKNSARTKKKTKKKEYRAPAIKFIQTVKDVKKAKVKKSK